MMDHLYKLVSPPVPKLPHRYSGSVPTKHPNFVRCGRKTFCFFRIKVMKVRQTYMYLVNVQLYILVLWKETTHGEQNAGLTLLQEGST